MKSIEEIKKDILQEVLENGVGGLEEFTTEVSQRYAKQYIDANKELTDKLEKQEKHLDILHKMVDHIQNHEVNLHDRVNRLIIVALHQISKL